MFSGSQEFRQTLGVQANFKPLLSLERKMASFIGVSSIYPTPAPELTKKATTTTSVSLQSLDNKSHFNNLLRAHLSSSGIGNFKSGSKPRVNFVPSAIATPNSSLLSEEAFKGLGEGFSDEDRLDDVSENEDFGYDSESETSSAANVDELDISKLGLPSRLVDSLLKRGISHLFPIQVCHIFSLTTAHESDFGSYIIVCVCVCVFKLALLSFYRYILCSHLILR